MFIYAVCSCSCPVLQALNGFYHCNRLVWCRSTTFFHNSVEESFYLLYLALIMMWRMILKLMIGLHFIKFYCHNTKSNSFKLNTLTVIRCDLYQQVGSKPETNTLISSYYSIASNPKAIHLKMKSLHCSHLISVYNEYTIHFHLRARSIGFTFQLIGWTRLHFLLQSFASGRPCWLRFH